ncbi:MAG: CoA transferase, partial [Acidimicrobiales bacterium]
GFEPMPFADGWGIATPTSDADFAGICRAFGVDGYDDPEVATMVARMTNRDAMRRMMDRIYAASALLPSREAMARLEAERVPCGELIAPADLPDDPHAVAMGLFEQFDDPVAGRVRLPRHPTRFASTPAAIRGPAPGLGQHTDEILGELGLADRIDELRSTAAVA